MNTGSVKRVHITMHIVQCGQAVNLRGFRASVNRRFEDRIPIFLDGIPDFMDSLMAF